MKLVRYGNPGKEKPGLIDADGKLRDLSAVVKDIGPDQLGDAALAKLRKLKTDKLPLVRGKPRLGSPINGVPKFIAIGLNYADHAAESGLPIPPDQLPFLFTPFHRGTGSAGSIRCCESSRHRESSEHPLGVARRVPPGPDPVRPGEAESGTGEIAPCRGVAVCRLGRV